MTTDYAQVNKTIDGVDLAGVREIGGYALGGGKVGQNEDAIILIAPDLTKQGYLINSQVPWQLAVGQQGVWAAISGHDTPKPDAVPWQAYRQLVGTVPTPEPVPGPTPPVEDCAAHLVVMTASRDNWQATAEACSAETAEYRDQIIILTTQRNTALTERDDWRYSAEEAEKRWNAIPKWMRGLLRVL